MSDENDNRIVVGQVVYAFTSVGMVKGFEECLSTGTLATCKEDWQPTGMYPPTVRDAKRLFPRRTQPAQPYRSNSQD